MKYLLILTVLLLTACLPATTPGYEDPYALREYGESLQEAADAQIEATKQAQMLEQQRKAMEVQSTQQAWSLQVTQTVYAQVVQQTLDAGHVMETQRAMQSTQAANYVNQTQAAQETEAVATAQVAEATAIAVSLAVEYEREIMQKQIFWVGIREAGKSIFLIFIMFMVGIGLWKYVPIILEWAIEWIDRRNVLFDGKSGTTAFILVDGIMKPMLIDDINHFRNRSMLGTGNAVNTVTLSPNKVTSMANTKPDRTPVIQLAAIDLLKLCEPDGNQIIPADKSGISEDNWMKITDSMVNAKLIEKHPGKGSFVIDGTCKDVLYALEMKQVTLSPTPSRYSAVDQLKRSEMVENG